MSYMYKEHLIRKLKKQFDLKGGGSRDISLILCHTLVKKAVFLHIKGLLQKAVLLHIKGLLKTEVFSIMYSA